MKRLIVDKIKNEFNIRKFESKKLEAYDFYTLCGLYKRLKSGGGTK